MAELFQFPLTRRTGFIRKQAGVIASMGQEAGYRHISRMLRLQIDSMRRKGIAEHIIDCEVSALGWALECASDKQRAAK